LTPALRTDENNILHCSTVAEVLAQLEQEEDDSTEVVDIFTEPPADEGVSDQDSDKSDGEYEFNVNHLGRKLLSTGCDVRRSSRIRQRQQDTGDKHSNREEEQEEEEPAASSSSVEQLPAARRSDKAPRQKECKVEKPVTPVWTKCKTLSTPAEIGSYTRWQFLDLTDLTSPLQFFNCFLTTR